MDRNLYVLCLYRSFDISKSVSSQVLADIE
jgi:hypothetical protein